MPKVLHVFLTCIQDGFLAGLRLICNYESNLNQIFIISIPYFLFKSWNDSRLSWSNTSTKSQDYSNIDSLFSTEVNVWTPALIIENS